MIHFQGSWSECSRILQATNVRLNSSKTGTVVVEETNMIKHAMVPSTGTHGSTRYECAVTE